MEIQHAGFFIEATSHCRDGQMPRWTFWVKGSRDQSGDGMIGTDRQGRGLYLYSTKAGSATAFREIVSPDSLTMADTLSRHQANNTVIQILAKLGWGVARPAPTRARPVIGLHRVA